MRARGLGQALGFTIAALVYLWAIRPAWPGWDPALAIAAVAAVLWRSGGEGFRPGHLRAAAVAWRRWWPAAFAAAAVAFWRQPLLPERAASYFLWCLAQQMLYQNLAYKGLRGAWGPGRRSWLASGLLFAALHLPNPVLAPATLVWGALSSRMFERVPCPPALGALQACFSWLLLSLAPRHWSRNFRVGPGYFRWTSASQTAVSLWASRVQP